MRRKRWFRLFGKKNREANLAFEQAHGRKPKKDELRAAYISVYRMINHLTRLKKTKRFAWMKAIPSQALQQIAERIDAGYQRFFDAKKNKSRRRISPPTYKRVRDYRSFTLKQAGWKLLDEKHVRLNGVDYRFFDSRPITGNIKTVTVVRDAIGHYYVCFSCEVEDGQSEPRAATGKTASRVILLRPQGA